METVNAFGLACPKPLMMAKAKIDEGARELSVHVDNEIAVKNVSRLAEKYGLNVAVETIEGGWSVNFSEDDRSVAAATLLLLRLPARQQAADMPCSLAKITWAKATPSLAITS